MDAGFVINLGVFIATAGAAAVAWWQAIEASRSRAEAARSEEAALHARRQASEALSEANVMSGVSMRAPFASALNQYAVALMSARLTERHLSAKTTFAILNEHTQRINETAFASGEDDTALLVSWVATYVVKFERTDSSAASLIADLKIVDDRLRRWVRDPRGVMHEIVADPRVDLTGLPGWADHAASSQTS